MRICECGGVITQHELVRNREAWTCTSCHRYEVIDRAKQNNYVVLPTRVSTNEILATTSYT